MHTGLPAPINKFKVSYPTTWLHICGLSTSWQVIRVENLPARDAPAFGKLLQLEERDLYFAIFLVSQGRRKILLDFHCDVSLDMARINAWRKLPAASATHEKGRVLSGKIVGATPTEILQMYQRVVPNAT